MANRVSRSLLDPWILPLVPRLYTGLRIPRAFPPEGIVLLGHLAAIGGAVGFAFAADHVWGGVVGAAGVVLNHIADMVDGTHARRTGQCRNGGELMDHFFDPLSFSYWMIGICTSCGRLDLALVAVVTIYANSVLTNIRAKMTGHFTLAVCGPTEFKTLLALFGLTMSICTAARWPAANVALWFIVALTVVFVPLLIVDLVRSVRQVNREGAAPDTSEWQLSNVASSTEIERP